MTEKPENKNAATSTVEVQHVYSVDLKDGIYHILKDDKLCRCHKTQPLVMPHPLKNELQIVPPLCNTQCSRAEIVVSDDKMFYFQTCEAIAKRFPIQNVEVKQKSTLLS